MSNALVDNDILFKITKYNLATDLLDSHPYGVDSFHILVAAKFMLRKRLEKHPPSRGKDVVLAELETTLKRINILEPTEEEVKLASQLEFIAAKADRELDNGESLLCAILMLRKWDFIFTGDKRAIYAVELLIEQNYADIQGKIACLEQIIDLLLSHCSFEEVRKKICSESGTDKSLDNCFSCRSEHTTQDNCLNGIISYINAIKSKSPKSLTPL